MSQDEANANEQSAARTPLKVAIIAGSTRPGRKADTVARWAYGLAAQRDDATFEVVDIVDYALPLFDEPVPPMAGRYMHPHTQKWAAKIESFDAFVFVTPEYNHSIPGALKNAIDFLFAEWNDKAAGFISYGFNGGFRASEHLRVIAGELKLATVRSSVALTFGEDFQGYTDFTPRSIHEGYVSNLLDEIVAWGKALRTVREATSAAA